MTAILPSFAIEGIPPSLRASRIRGYKYISAALSAGALISHYAHTSQRRKFKKETPQTKYQRLDFTAKSLLC